MFLFIHFPPIHPLRPSLTHKKKQIIHRRSTFSDILLKMSTILRTLEKFGCVYLFCRGPNFLLYNAIRLIYVYLVICFYR